MGMRFFKFFQGVANSAGTWITIVGALGTGVMTWVFRSIAFIAQYGWGAVVLSALVTTCVLAFAFSASLVAWRYFRPLQPPLPDTTDRASHKTDSFLDALHGEAHERLELFIVDFLAPACLAQAWLQRATLKAHCHDEQLIDFAYEGLFVCEALRFARAFALSPLPEATNRQMIDCIARLENGGYQAFCDQAAKLREKAGEKYWTNETAECRLEWMKAHNALVSAYDSLKREPKFKALYRPHLKSRWGDIEPITR